MTRSQTSFSQARSSRRLMAISPRREWVCVVLILLVATALRFCCLDSVPPGLTHDEANNVHDAASVLRGARPFYFPVAQGKEPLYPYSVALMMALVGPTAFAMRLTTAWWGLLLVALTYAWTRRAFNPSVALWTAAGLALSFWGVSTSRVGLRAVTLPVLFTAALVLLRPTAARPPRLVRSVSAGLLLGLTLYTYLAARLMPAVPLLFGLYLFLIKRKRWRQRWRSWALALVVAAVVATPLFLYLRAHPSAEIRVGQLDRPLRALLEGDAGPLGENLSQTLLSFSFRGDGFVPYNIPGRPIFDPLMSLLFYAGLLIALWRWRDPAHALGLLWLAVGFFPALATGVDASCLRAIGAQPILFLFPALALESLRSVRISRLRLSGVIGGLALAVVFFTTARDYFVRWPNHRDVRVHYHVDLLTVADVLQRRPPDEPVVVSAFYPMQYHDPRVIEAVLGPGDDALTVRWFDGRQALLLPSAAPRARLILPAAIPLDEELWLFVEPHATLDERVSLRPGDFNPTFDVYHWSVEGTQAELQAAMMAPLQPARPPVNLGEHLSLLGYRLQGWTGEPGRAWGVLTLWRVETPLPADRDVILFTQLLDDQNRVVAQQDQTGVPSWDWRSGDLVLQFHRLSLPAGVEGGQYALIAGVYTVPDRVDAVLSGHEPDPGMPRLPVVVDGVAVGDHVLLQVVESADL